VNFLSEEKEGSTKKKEISPTKPNRRRESAIAPYSPPGLRREFDRAFERFRRDFENIRWPSERFFERFPMMREPQTRMPSLDLEDREKDFLLTAEIPGFKKEEIEILVQDDAVEITGNKNLSRDEKLKGYVRKERSSESFYRRIRLPEQVKTESSQASLREGVLELVLPKKTPKSKKKVNIK
jgi:HSP20 family protein